jgi:hypothetical protein
MNDEVVRLMTDDTIRFLIEQKMSYVNSTVNVCMLWWASSIVFCGYVLAGVWSKQQELRQTRTVIGLGIVLFVFFFVIALFGGMVAYRLGIVQDEIAELAVKLNFQDDFFHTEILTFQISMWIGACSFALVWFVWCLFWYFFLWRQRAQEKPAKA